MNTHRPEHSNPYAAPTTPVEQPAQVHWTFCGMQAFVAKPDRYYKVFITDQGLYAGWLGGQFYNKMSVRYQLSPLYITIVGALIVEPLAMWIDSRRRQLENRYDALIAEPANFLAADRRNTFIPRAAIETISVSNRRSSWMAWMNRGILKVARNDGEPAVEWMIGATRLLDEVVSELAAAGYPIQRETPGEA